jgi:hypothetical protein
MATLSELAGTQRTTSIPNAEGGGVASAGGTSIQPKQQIDNTSGLIKDIGKMFGGIMQEHQEASSYAGKRVGMDNMVSYRSDMEFIEQEFEKKKTSGGITAADYMQKNREEQGLYEKYLQKGHFGNNNLANQSFVDTYASPAYDVLNRSQTANMKLYTAEVQKETRINSENTINSYGTDITPDVINGIKSSYSNIDLNPKEVDDIVMTAIQGSINKEFKLNKSSYIDIGGNVDKEKLNEYIKKSYSSLTKSYIVDENGKASIETTMGDKVKDGKMIGAMESSKNYIMQEASNIKIKYRSEIDAYTDSILSKDAHGTDEMGNVYSFESDVKVYEAKITNNFPAIDKDTMKQMIKKWQIANHKTAEETYEDPTELLRVLAAMKDAYKNGNNASQKELVKAQSLFESYKILPFTKSDTNKITTSMYETQELQQAYRKVADSFPLVVENINNPEVINKFINDAKNGSQIKSTYNENSIQIESSFAIKIVDKKIKPFVDDLTNIPLSYTQTDANGTKTVIGVDIFNKNLDVVLGMTPITGESETIKKYRSLYESTGSIFGSVDEAKKSLLYNTRMAETDTSLAYTYSINKQLMEILDKKRFTPDGKPMSVELNEHQNLSVFQATRDRFTRNMFAKEDYQNSYRYITKSFSKLAEGSLSYWTNLNSKVQDEVKQDIFTMMQQANKINGTQEDYNDFIDNIPSTDLGSILPAMFTGQDKRIFHNSKDNISFMSSNIEDTITKSGLSYDEISVISRRATYIDPITKTKTTGWVQDIRNSSNFTIDTVTPASAAVFNENEISRKAQKKKNIENFFINKGGLIR